MYNYPAGAQDTFGLANARTGKPEKGVLTVTATD